MSTNRIGPGSATDLLRVLSSIARGTLSPLVSTTTSTTAKAHDPAILRKRLTDLVRNVDLDDERAVGALRRPVLREILLCEFGTPLREHPEFSPMLESIEQTLDSDPSMPGKFVEVLRALRD